MQKRNVADRQKIHFPKFEVVGLSAEGTVNLALDKNIKLELQNQLANKSEDMLTNDEKTFLKNQHENKLKTLNIRFTESKYQSIIKKCEQFDYLTQFFKKH